MASTPVRYSNSSQQQQQHQPEASTSAATGNIVRTRDARTASNASSALSEVGAAATAGTGAGVASSIDAASLRDASARRASRTSFMHDSKVHATERDAMVGAGEGGEAGAGAAAASSRTSQLAPINTRLSPSYRSPNSASTSATSSNAVSATSSAAGSPRLSQQYPSTSSLHSQPASSYSRSRHPSSRHSSPGTELSSTFSSNANHATATHRLSSSPRNSSILPSASPPRWSPAQSSRPDQSVRSGSPANSSGSASSHRNHPHHPISNETRFTGEASGKPSALGIATSTSKDRLSNERSGAQGCAKCDSPMTGQFVRALGSVFHLDCFRCQDCNKVVAAKFFPVDAMDGGGRQFPLCETDYFRRLGLLCSKCGSALRGSYITALDMKFHVEHFTCSVCPTVFGPQDSYYEHAGSVYCHFHYSTRFAVKCTGCRTAILKQFVEINRNSMDEHWHPECYMIHKFWNIKLAPSPPLARAIELPSSSSHFSNPVESSLDATGPPSRALEAAEYLAQEESETPISLKARQKLMEEQVYRIWTVLSAFEESSASCISEMLRHVSSGQYIEGVRMAEKFVLHVETLFSAIDDLSDQFKKAGAKEIAHVREARMLCKKVVNFFSLLSHTHETGARKMSITQELLSLVTGLAHYLKILIRIALTAALKLEREYSNDTAIGNFLGRLDRLARNPDASKFSPPATVTAANERISNGNESDNLRAYGYQSLSNAVGTSAGQGEATTDLCEGCRLTVEEECARFGTGLRWHLACLQCAECGKLSSKDLQPSAPADGSTPSVYLSDFKIEPIFFRDEGGGTGQTMRFRTCCSSCSPADGREGMEYATRLEQYAFLLCVALNKLYALLKQRGVVPSSPMRLVSEVSPDAGDRNLYDAYRNSTDTKRMKFVSLDRQISTTTTARTPIRSTIIQSPTGRVAQSNDSVKPPVPSRRDQPQLEPSRSSTVPHPRIDRDGQHPQQSYRSLPPEDSTSFASSRPSFNRANTAIHIVDDHVNDPPAQPRPDLLPHLGRAAEPHADEGGSTIPGLARSSDVDHAGVQQHRYQPTRSGTLLSELSALEYFIVKHVAALMLASEDSAFKDVAPLDDLLELIDSRKNTFWGKLFKGAEKKSVKKKGVFGISLEVLVDRNGADSMHGSGPGSLRVPSFVDDCISAMKQMDMSVEGVFRKNGNIRRLKDLSEALDRDSTLVNLSDENPVQLAALLKRFLRDLPDPLLTFKLFHLFIATQKVEDLAERKKIMHLVCCLLPKYHRDTMEVIFVFLKWVASFSHVDEETGSKMDLLNLATVICPNILYSKGKDPYKDESFSAVRAVHELLEFQDEFWQVPEEFASILNDQDLFSNPADLTSKQILAKAESFVRRNSLKPSGTPVRGVVHPPQRPHFQQQAYSAPIDTMRRRTESTEREVMGGGSGDATSRPVSFSTFDPHPSSNNSSPTSTTPRLLPRRPSAPTDYRQGEGADASERLPLPTSTNR